MDKDLLKKKWPEVLLYSSVAVFGLILLIVNKWPSSGSVKVLALAMSILPALIFFSVPYLKEIRNYKYRVVVKIISWFGILASVIFFLMFLQLEHANSYVL